MRYRIVIELDTQEPRQVVNKLAERIYDEAFTRYTTPVFLSTEIVESTIDVLRR
jgi:hypothetical protein